MKKHNFHMVENSPWPILVSFTVLFTLLGGVMYMHFLKQGLTILLCSLGLLVIMMSFWFRDVIREGTFLKEHSEKVMVAIRFGLWEKIKVDKKDIVTLNVVLFSIDDNNLKNDATNNNLLPSYNILFFVIFIIILMLIIKNIFDFEAIFNRLTSKQVTLLILFLVYIDISFLVIRYTYVGNISLHLFFIFEIFFFFLLLISYYYDILKYLTFEKLSKYPRVENFILFFIFQFVAIQSFFKLEYKNDENIYYNVKKLTMKFICFFMLSYLAIFFNLLLEYLIFLIIIRLITQLFQFSYKKSIVIKSKVHEKVLLSNQLQTALTSKSSLLDRMVVRNMVMASKAASVTASGKLGGYFIFFCTGGAAIAESYGKHQIDRDYNNNYVNPIFNQNNELAKLYIKNKSTGSFVPYPPNNYSPGDGLYRSFKDISKQAAILAERYSS